MSPQGENISIVAAFHAALLRLVCNEYCVLSVLCFLLSMRLFVDPVETRDRWLLTARCAAAGKRAAHESVAVVLRDLFLEETSGTFSPRELLLPTTFPLPLCSPRGQRFIEKPTLAPGRVCRGYYGSLAR